MQQEQQKKDESNNLIPILGGLALLAAAAPITAKILSDKRNKASNSIPNPVSQPVTPQGIPNTSTQPPRTYKTPDVWYQTRTKARDYEYYNTDFTKPKGYSFPYNITPFDGTSPERRVGYNSKLDISYAELMSPYKDDVGRDINHTVYAKGKLEGDWYAEHIAKINDWHGSLPD
tara:strand:- start:378 stop:899 length:522 start_codon:yes stop_codon:yes gene_type:complete